MPEWSRSRRSQSIYLRMVVDNHRAGQRTPVEPRKWEGSDGLTVEIVSTASASGEWARFAGVTADAAFVVTRRGAFLGAYADVEALGEAVDLSTLAAIDRG